MRFELKRIQRELGITTIYVTHDQAEALALSHMIAVMDRGRIVQIGTPRDVYERPSDRFVADFVGTTNFLDAAVVGAGGSERCRVRTAVGELNVRCGEYLRANDSVLVSVRPEDVELSEQPLQQDDGDNFRVGEVQAKAFLGDCLDFQVKIGDFTVLARAHPSLRTPIGDKIYVRMRADKCVAVPQC
jgi:iron(III) transport system ATP-binding protein